MSDKEYLEAIADKLGAEISEDTEHFTNCSEDHFMASLGNIHTDWNWTEGAAKRELVTKLREIISPPPTITAAELGDKILDEVNKMIDHIVSHHDGENAPRDKLKEAMSFIRKDYLESLLLKPLEGKS